MSVINKKFNTSIELAKYLMTVYPAQWGMEVIGFYDTPEWGFFKCKEQYRNSEYTLKKYGPYFPVDYKKCLKSFVKFIDEKTDLEFPLYYNCISVYVGNFLEHEVSYITDGQLTFLKEIDEFLLDK